MQAYFSARTLNILTEEEGGSVRRNTPALMAMQNTTMQSDLSKLEEVTSFGVLDEVVQRTNSLFEGELLTERLGVLATDLLANKI